MTQMSQDDLRQNVSNIRAKLEEKRKTSFLTDKRPLKSASKSATSAVNFTCTRTLKGHYGKIYALQWSGKDSNFLVSASQDGKLMVWNALTTNKRVAIPLRSSWVMSCAYSPDGKMVACGGLDNLCSVYKIRDNDAGFVYRAAHRELQQHEGYLSCCRFINGSEIITSSGDATCILWDIENRQAKRVFSGHTGDVMSVSLNGNDNGNTFISGSCDQTAKLWDVRDNKRDAIKTFTGHKSDINTVQWFPDQMCFGTGSDDANVFLYDTRAYCLMNSYAEKSYGGVTAIDFSKSGKYLFAGYDEKPFSTVWDTLSANKLQDLPDQTHRTSCLGVNNDGTALCTGSWDMELKVWA